MTRAMETTGAVGRELGRLFDSGVGTTAGLGESQLLDRFLERRDEAAFEALVLRFGPMVHGVCRRNLSDPMDVEDAFQATFLVLVRRARSIRHRTLLGNWLYGVARRVSVRARANAAARRSREGAGGTDTVRLLAAPLPGDLERREVEQVIDEEVGRLPSQLMSAVVLCYLQGCTHEEAAMRLGWPVGTVRSRLARARRVLKTRLARRGLAPAATSGVLAAVLTSPGRAASVVPSALVEATMRQACGVAGASGLSFLAGVGASSQPAMSLARGVMAASLASKVGATAGVLAVAASLAAAGWWGSGEGRPVGPGEGLLAVMDVGEEKVQVATAPTPVAEVNSTAQASGQEPSENPPSDPEARRVQLQARYDELRIQQLEHDRALTDLRQRLGKITDDLEMRQYVWDAVLAKTRSNGLDTPAEEMADQELGRKTVDWARDRVGESEKELSTARAQIEGVSYRLHVTATALQNIRLELKILESQASGDGAAEAEQPERAGVPVLGDLPILGKLFRLGPKALAEAGTLVELQPGANPVVGQPGFLVRPEGVGEKSYRYIASVVVSASELENMRFEIRVVGEVEATPREGDVVLGRIDPDLVNQATNPHELQVDPLPEPDEPAKSPRATELIAVGYLEEPGVAPFETMRAMVNAEHFNFGELGDELKLARPPLGRSGEPSKVLGQCLVLGRTNHGLLLRLTKTTPGYVPVKGDLLFRARPDEEEEAAKAREELKVLEARVTLAEDAWKRQKERAERVELMGRLSGISQEERDADQELLLKLENELKRERHRWERARDRLEEEEPASPENPPAQAEETAKAPEPAAENAAPHRANGGLAPEPETSAPHRTNGGLAPESTKTNSPPTVYVNTRRVRIPFAISESHQDRVEGIRLSVSDDEGKTWRELDEVKGDAKAVTFEAPKDGRYWFKVKTIVRETKSGEGATTIGGGADAGPVLSVVVDTEGPKLETARQQRRGANFEVTIVARDANLPLKNSSLECRIAGSEQNEWIPIPAVEGTRVPGAVPSVAYRFASNAKTEGPFWVRYSAEDRAGNGTTMTWVIEPEAVILGDPSPAQEDGAEVQSKPEGASDILAEPSAPK